MADVSGGSQQVQGSVGHDAVDESTVRPIVVGSTAASDTPTAVSAGDRVRAYFDTSGRQVVRIASADSTLTVDTEMPSAAALADGASNPTSPIVGAAGLVYNGSTWDRLRGDTTGANSHVTPTTSGGLSISRTLSAASTNGTNVKASAGQLYGWYVFNTNASVRYVKLYNKATTPTVGTDTPVMTIPVPSGGGANVEFANGITFATGIGFGMTTGVADNDTGAVAANDLILNLFYK